MEPITIETTIAYPAKWRIRDEERLIMFTIPFHEQLRSYFPTALPKAIPCYYRNLRFKYGTLTKGTSVKITADIEKGSRGGLQLHIKEIEIIGSVVKDLTKVNAKMVNKWTKQFEKQNGSKRL